MNHYRRFSQNCFARYSRNRHARRPSAESSWFCARLTSERLNFQQAIASALIRVFADPLC